MIFTTVYTSEMVRPMSDPELVDLLVDSRNRNAARGITGLLLYRSGRVMQMLEGEARAVRALYDRIRMDVRHQRVTNVWTSSASERRFPSWTMGFEDLERNGLTAFEDGHATAGGEAGALSQSLVAPADATAEQQNYFDRRRAALRRALVSGDRLVGALGIILNGHDPEVLLDAGGTSSVRCRVCRGQGAPVLDSYPCPTAKNALWALEASGFR